MARIKNKNIYIDDAAITGADYLIGTDAGDNKRTKSYPVSGLSEYIANNIISITRGNQATGSVTWTGTGLIFESTVITGVINGNSILIPADPNIVLQDAHGDLDRIDLFVANENNTLTVVTGQPSLNPITPPIDELTQVLIGFVLIKGGTTVPDGLSQVLVYNEFLGEPTEWTTTTNNPSVIDLGSTNDPQLDSLSIELKSPGTAETILFTTTTPVNIEDFYSLNLKIKNVASSRFLASVTLSSASEDLGVPVIIRDNVYGYFDTTTGYQNVTIPKSDFNLSSGQLSKILIKSKSGDTVFIDNIRLNLSNEIGTIDNHDLQFVLDNGFIAKGGTGDQNEIRLDVYDSPEFYFQGSTDTDDLKVHVQPTDLEVSITDKVNLAKHSIRVTQGLGLELERRALGMNSKLNFEEPTNNVTFSLPAPSKDINYYIPMTVGDEIADSQGFIRLEKFKSKVVADTGTTINLDTIGGSFCNMLSPNTNEAFTADNASFGVIGAWAQVLINTVNEPVITNAIQQGGVPWTTATPLYLNVVNKGSAGNSYYYLPLSVNTSSTGSTSLEKRTGSTIIFDTNTEYNAESPLSSGNIILDNTGAVQGVESTVYIKMSTAPTISGIGIQAKLGSEFYPDKLNIYHFRYNTNNQVLLSISVDNTPQLIAPLNFTATVDSETSLLLNWDDDSNATNYVLYRATINDFSNETEIYSGSTSSYIDTGLTVDTQYFYRAKSQAIGFLDSDFSTTSGTPISQTFDFSVTGMTKTGNDYQNTSAGNYGDGYGVSTSAIPDAVDGSFEFVIDIETSDSQGVMFGLSTHGQQVAWTDAGNPWKFISYLNSANNQINISVDGSTPATYTGSIATIGVGNVLKLVRNGSGNVKLFENLVEIHDFGTLTGNLYAHISQFNGKYVKNPRIE